MGSSGKGDQSSRLQDGYNRGASAYTPGATLDEASLGSSNLSNAYKQGWLSQANAQQSAAPAFAGFEMPDFTAQNDASMAEYQARLDAQAAENAKNAALSQMNTLYSNRMDAASTSVDYINQTINQERSDAALMGVDYTVTAEDKQARINNYFASVWGEGDETSLNNLMGTWGAPSGHTEFTVTRGDATLVPGSTEGDTEVVSGSKGMKKKTAITDDDEGLGGGTTVLGGA